MTHEPNEAEIKDVWSSYWSKKTEHLDWDSLSEIILRTLEQEVSSTSGDKVMEAGCGTGRISHQLALLGAKVTCLDITPEALELASQRFADTPGRFILGSILELPRDERYSLVWNAGVIEHFTREDQRRALGEFLSALEPGGRAVIFTPYSRSLPYRAAKLFLELLGAWPYGKETPKSSVVDCLPAGATLVAEYTVAFLPLFFDAYKFFKPLRTPLQALWNLAMGRLGVESLVRWDRALSRCFGGYLLVSVLETK